MSTGSALVDTTALLVDVPVSRLSMGEDVCFADLDNDGDLDVYGQYRQFLNQGAAPVTAVGGTPASAASSALEQNFPNPFNPNTTIRYRVGTSGPVTLTIYNVAGQRVRTLVNQARHPEGTRTVVWDGRNHSGERVASGVYLCRLNAPDFRQTRKLVLLK